MKATLTAAVLALAFAMPAYAETPQTVPGSSVEGTWSALATRRGQ